MSYKLAWLSLVCTMLLTACNTSQPKPIEGKPPHHTTAGFQNPHSGPLKKTFFGYLVAKYFGDEEWADHLALADTVPVQEAELPTDSPSFGEIEVTWLGHSTFLIRIGSKVILTDPVFSDRASPVSFAGPKRYVPHVVNYAQLPNIDLVIISHDHYDHLDKETIRFIGSTTKYAVPLRLASWFIDNGINKGNVHEFDWWDKKSLGKLTIQATPSQHWSGRGLTNRNSTLWASWLIEIGGKKVWFAGDTGYNAIDFKEIGSRSPGIDLALIPIGGYAPRSFMSTDHVNPSEAIKIHKDLNAGQSIGMHWGTFPLTAEAPMAPVRELEAQKLIQGIAQDEFVSLKVGQSITIH